MEKARQNYVFDARLTKSSGSSARSLRRNHTFFKIFLPNLSSNHLKIPPAFHQHILEEAPGRFYLKGPSNYIWGVDLVKKLDGLFFTDGWDEFVSDHSLATGDFLLFQYNGNFMFSVMVFDNTACEKAKAFLAYPTCDKKVVFSVNEGQDREEFDAVLRIEEFGKRKRSAIDKITDCRVDAMPRTWSIFSQEFSRELVSVTSTDCKLYGSSSDLFNKTLVCSRDFKTKKLKKKKEGWFTESRVPWFHFPKTTYHTEGKRQYSCKGTYIQVQQTIFNDGYERIICLPWFLFGTSWFLPV